MNLKELQLLKLFPFRLIHRHLGISASARASAYIYNTPQEVDAFVDTLQDTIKFFKELS